MRSYAASRWATTQAAPAGVAAVPVHRAQIAATAAIVGAIIGEGPGGILHGLGRAIITFNQYYITGPEKLWAAIVVASLLGYGSS